MPEVIQKRVIEKFLQLKSHHNIFILLGVLKNFEPATHRLRIGSYRIVMELKSRKAKNITFLILKIGHRKNIYC